MPTGFSWNWSNRSSKLINLDPEQPWTGRGTNMAQHVVEFGKDGRPVELRRPSRRAGISPQPSGDPGGVARHSLPGNPATSSRPAAAPASMWSISRGEFPRSPGGRAISTSNISKASRRGGRYSGLPNIRPPLRIDLSDPAWCPEMHDGSGPGKIAGGVLRQRDPHRAVVRCRGSVCGRRARPCDADGRLFLYGPFKRGGKHTAISNAVFDSSLRDRNAEWGVRDIEALEKLAAKLPVWR